MSSLYEARVEAVTAEYVDIYVRVVHPDAGPVSEGRVFALSMLYDPIDYYHYGKEPAVRDCPLGREMDIRDYLEEGVMMELAGGFISKVELIREINHPPLMYGDEGYETFWGEEESEVDEDDDGDDDDDTSAPRERVECAAVLRIWPTHPAWIEHMRVGMEWDTAAYDLGDGEEWEEGTTRVPGDRHYVLSEDHEAGMRRYELTSHDYEFHKVPRQLKSLWMPIFGPRRYGTWERLEGAQITPSKLRKLVGEPVLLQPRDGRREAAVLTLVDEQHQYVQVVRLSARGGSSSGVGISKIEWIGRAYVLVEIDAARLE